MLRRKWSLERISSQMHDKWFERHWFIGGNQGSAYLDGFAPEGKIVRTAGLLKNVGGERTMTAAGPTRSIGPPPEGKILTEPVPLADTTHKGFLRITEGHTSGKKNFLCRFRRRGECSR